MSEKEIEKVAKALERIGMVLGALYASHLGDLDQSFKADRLSRCGFGNEDVANVLGTTTNAINVALHRARKGKRKSKR